MKPEVETRPHDFRVVCGGYPPPIVVGGQAVNLWALTYLPEVPQNQLVSADLDIMVDREGHARLKNLPKWYYERNSLRNFADIRVAFLRSKSADDRPLLVEVLHSVHGLDAEDLKGAATTELDGVTYRSLDPVVMLKAKAANVRDIKQDDVPPRNDREHLSIIARCVPRYLEDIKAKAEQTPEFERAAVQIFMRLYRTLEDRRFVPTLRAEGITPASLLPDELRNTAVDRLKRMHAFQWPLVEKAWTAQIAPRLAP